MLTKNQLRKKYKTLRTQLTASEIEDYSLAIANQLLTLNIWNKSLYHIFLTIEAQQEVNTDYILNILSGKDKNISVSKSNFETYTMRHFLLSDNTTLQLNSYNIPEPIDGLELQTSQIDIVFVPLLAFDINGHRVGYGKGFYDLFLNACKPNTLKIGLSFFEAEAEILNISETDVKLDYCVTPKTVYRF